MRSLICLDIDGVLRPFVERAREVFIKSHPGAEVDHFTGEKDLYDCYPMNKQYVRKFIFEEAVEDIFLNVDPYPTAKEEFEFLKAYCDDNDLSLMIVSSQFSFDMKILTLEWLEKHDMLTTDIAFILHPNKFVVDGYYLIDDEPGNLEEWQKSGKFPICFNRAWNENWKGVKINSLKQLPTVVEISRLMNKTFL